MSREHKGEMLGSWKSKITGAVVDVEDISE
jgi:hypothetical protein